MANTFTPTYNLIKPEVGADTNAWGSHLNSNFDAIDTNMVSRTLGTAQTFAGAINLPSNGLNVGSGQLRVTGGNVTMSGQLTVSQATTLSTTLTVSSNVTFQGGFSLTGAGATSLGGTLTVAGATVLAYNGLNVGSGQLNCTGGNVSMSGALTVTGACATGNSTVNGTLNVTGATTLVSNGLNVGSGQLQVTGGNVTASGNITSSGNLSGVDGSLSGTLGVTGAATFSSTMSVTGLVTASTAPTTGGHLTNKTYVDAQDALKLSLTGGTMSGNIVFAAGQPTATTAAAAIVQLTDSISSTSVTTAATPNSVKTAYDLANAAVPKSGGTMTGALTLPANGLNVGSGQLNVTGGNVSMSGQLSVTGAATFSSTLTASTAPSSGGHLTNKTYVDANDALKLNLTGGTLTGNLSIINSTTEMTLTLGSSAGYYYGNGTAAGFKNSSGTNRVSWNIASGDFTAAGNVTAYSDARLKENVETISNALDLVNRMRGVFYDRIDTGEAGVGVIAQEMEEVIPEVVIPSDGVLTVAYGNLVGVLIEAVKELSAKVDALEAK